MGGERGTWQREGPEGEGGGSKARYLYSRYFWRLAETLRESLTKRDDKQGKKASVGEEEKAMHARKGLMLTPKSVVDKKVREPAVCGMVRGGGPSRSRLRSKRAEVSEGR